MTPYVTFFGDAEYTFKLTPALIDELEKKCGAGLGTIGARVFAKHFTQADLTETIRLALIGGGTEPKRARELVAAYATDRPITETYPLAAKILERLWIGAPHETEMEVRK